MGNCDPGLRQTRQLKVSRADTAPEIGSGEVPVVGTPAILALAEAACVDAICEDLPEGHTTVGAWAEIEHERPSAIGATLIADATLIGHHGRRLEFSVLVRDGDDVVAKVRHRRVLVDRERYLAKVGITASGRKRKASTASA